MIHCSESGEPLLERRFDTDRISIQKKPLPVPSETYGHILAYVMYRAWTEHHLTQRQGFQPLAQLVAF